LFFAFLFQLKEIYIMSNLDKCSNCYKPKPKYACLCKEYAYCGNDCAEQHWGQTHQFDCIAGSQKRDRDTSISDDDIINLRLSDGELGVEGKYAREFQTIEDLVADAGSDAVIPLLNISKDVMKKLVYITSIIISQGPNDDEEMIFRNIVAVVPSEILIDVFLAANYLNAKDDTALNLNGKPTSIMNLLGRFIVGYIGKQKDQFKIPKNSGFDQEEKDLLQKFYYRYRPDLFRLRLPQPGLVKPEYRVFEIPSDLWISYILPHISNKPLFELRTRHIVLYSTVSEYLLKRARKVFPELDNYSDETVFRALGRLITAGQYDGKYSIKESDVISEFGFQKKKLGDLSSKVVRGEYMFDLREVIIKSIQKFKTWDQLEIFKKKRDANNQKARDRAARIKTSKEDNSEKLRQFLEKLGVKNAIYEVVARNPNAFNRFFIDAYKKLRNGPIEDIENPEDPNIVLIRQEIQNIYAKWIKERNVEMLYNYFNVDKFYEAAGVIYQEEKSKKK